LDTSKFWMPFFSGQSLLLSTTILNDIYTHTHIRIYICTYVHSYVCMYGMLQNKVNILNYKNNIITFVISHNSLIHFTYIIQIVNTCVKWLCIILFKSVITILLNQARAGLRPARAWFFEITFVRDVCMCACVCVCVRPRGY